MSDKVEAIKERLAKITAPWTMTVPAIEIGYTDGAILWDGEGCNFGEVAPLDRDHEDCDFRDGRYQNGNADFIINAPTDIDTLLAALEESERERERTQQGLHALSEQVKNLDHYFFESERLRAELEAAKAEVTTVLESLGPHAIRVRENGGPEDIYASLAVSVAKLSKLAAVRNDVIDEAIEKVAHIKEVLIYRPVSNERVVDVIVEELEAMKGEVSDAQ